MIAVVENVALARDLSQHVLVIHLSVLSAHAELALIEHLALHRWHHLIRDAPYKDLVRREVLLVHHKLPGRRHSTKLLVALLRLLAHLEYLLLPASEHFLPMHF